MFSCGVGGCVWRKKERCGARCGSDTSGVWWCGLDQNWVVWGWGNVLLTGRPVGVGERGLSIKSRASVTFARTVRRKAVVIRGPTSSMRQPRIDSLGDGTTASAAPPPVQRHRQCKLRLASTRAPRSSSIRRCWRVARTAQAVFPGLCRAAVTAAPHPPVSLCELPSRVRQPARVARAGGGSAASRIRSVAARVY
jgi:hypothetical protein